MGSRPALDPPSSAKICLRSTYRSTVVLPLVPARGSLSGCLTGTLCALPYFHPYLWHASLHIHIWISFDAIRPSKHHKQQSWLVLKRQTCRIKFSITRWWSTGLKIVESQSSVPYSKSPFDFVPKRIPHPIAAHIPIIRNGILAGARIMTFTQTIISQRISVQWTRNNSLPIDCFM